MYQTEMESESKVIARKGYKTSYWKIRTRIKENVLCLVPYIVTQTQREISERDLGNEVID